jgi:LPS export ABC transporter permease LptF/LPS export ABC transporter permease LptG
MFKSFDKYILKEAASPFGIGLLVYTFTLLINMIFLLSGVLIAKEASLLTVMQILLYMLPDFLSFTIPMSTLMGILAGLSRMSSDSEILAFRTMGINNFRILKPIMVFAVINWLFSSWLIMYMAPEAGYRLANLMAQVQSKRTISDIKPREFYTKMEEYTLFFNDTDPRTGEWKDVFLYSRKRGDVDTVILAKYGRFFQKVGEEESYFMLKDALVHSYARSDPQQSYELTRYEYKKEKVPNLSNIKQTRREKMLIFPELVRRIKKEPQNLHLKIEFHRKFALPFACLALGFLALSLGISTKKGGKISGFIISLAIIFVYYTTSITTENMVRKGILSPFLGMWAADIFLLVLGIILYYFTSREKTINWERLYTNAGNFFKGIKNRLKHKKKKQRNIVLVIKIQRFTRTFRIFKIIDRYVLKRLLLAFSLVFSSLLLVFYIINIVELIDDVVENDVAFHYVFKYLYHHTPEIISFVLPVAILTAVLLTYSVMSKNNELIAVQVSGISLYRLTLPAILIGAILCAGYFFVQEVLEPFANKRKREIFDIIHKRKSQTEQEIPLNWVRGTDNTFYFFEYMDRASGRILKFNVLNLNDDFTLNSRLHARTGRWLSPQELVLEMGYEREYRQGAPERFRRFTSKLIRVQEGPELFTKRIVFPEYMNIKILKSYINYLKEKHSDSRKYEARLFYKYAFPLSSLMMVLIAIPFSFIMGNKGTLFGIGIAVAISMVFWFTFAVFSALGSAAILSPFISAFAPIFLFAFISGYLFMNIKT